MPEKNYPANKIENLTTNIKWSLPNNPISKEEIDPQNPDQTIVKYYAALMVTGATPQGQDMEGIRQVIEKYMGAAKDIPWTPQEVYDAAKNYNAMNTVVAADIKTVWKNTINQGII